MPQDLDYTYIGVQGQCNRCEMPVQSPCLMDGISGIAYMYCSLETVRKQSPFARPWKPGTRLVHAWWFIGDHCSQDWMTG